MIAKTNALIFCAHGSSSQIHYENVKKLVNYIKNKVDADCFFCFIEKSEPNIDKFFDEIRKTKYQKLFFFPLFLFNGNHLLIDVKKKILHFKNSTSKDVILIEKLSLLKDISPVVSKILKKQMKKNIHNIVITFCSPSNNKKVKSELENYTEKLNKLINPYKSYFRYVGEEKKLIDSIKGSSKDYFLLINQLFLFDGFLQKKNKDFFTSAKDIYISNTLSNINPIKKILTLKLIKSLQSFN